jgi:hypothetical protein
MRFVLVFLLTLAVQAQTDLSGRWTGGFGGTAVISRDGQNWRIDADWGKDNTYVIHAVQEQDMLIGGWHGPAGKSSSDPNGTKRHKWAAIISPDGNTLTPVLSKCEDAGRSHWAWGTLKRAR